MSATFVQGNGATTFSSTVTRSAAYSSPNGVGNLLICIAVSHNSPTTFSISDTAHNTWIPLIGGLLSSTTDAMQAWYCLSANGGANTVTVTDNTSGNTNRWITIGEWTGGTFLFLDRQNSLDNGFGITAAASGNITTQDATDLLIGYFHTTNSKTFSASGGNTVEFTASGGQSCFTDQNVSSVGTYAQAVTWSGSSGCGAGIAAFQVVPYTPFNTVVGRLNDGGFLVGALMAPIWSNANITPVTVNANSTSDQSLMSDMIPANTMNKYGRTLKLHLSGVYSTPAASTATLEFKIKLGSLTLIDIVTSANAGSVTNNKWSMDVDITTQTNGAAAAFECSGKLFIDLGALTSSVSSIFSDTNAATVGTLDSTAAQTLQVTVAFSAGSASNACTQRQMVENTVN